MAGSDELVGKLTIDATSFLQGITNALQQGAERVSKFISSGGKASIQVDTTGATAGVHAIETELSKLDVELKKPHTITVDASQAAASLDEVGKKAGGFGGILQSALGFAGGALISAGLGGLTHGIGGIFEAGIKATKGLEELKLGFQTAGFSGAALDAQIKSNAKTVGELSNAYAISKGEINGATATYLKFGGSTDRLQEKQEIIIGLAKRAGISYEAAGKALSKATDPEIEAQLTKIGIKFEKGATESQRFATIQEKVKGTLDGMKEAAQGPVGSMERLENTFKSITSTVGVSLINALGPAFDALGAVATFVAETVVPAIKGAITPIVDFVNQTIGGVISFIGEHTAVFAIVGAAILAIGIASQAAAIGAAAFAAAETVAATAAAARAAAVELFVGTQASSIPVQASANAMTAAGVAAQEAYASALAEGATAEEATAASALAYVGAIEAATLAEASASAAKVAAVASQEAYDIAIAEGATAQEAAAISAQVYAATLAETTVATEITTEATAGLNETLLANPVVLVVAGLAALGAAVYLAYQNIQSFRDGVDAAWAKIKEFLVTVRDAVMPVLEALWPVLKQLGAIIIDVIVANFQIWWGIIKTVAGVLFDIISAVVKFIGHLFGLDKATKSAGDSTSFLTKAMNFLVEVLHGVKLAFDVIQAAIAGLIGAFDSIGTTISNFFTLLTGGDIIGAIKAFAGLGDSVASGFTDAYLKKLKDLRSPEIPAPHVAEGEGDPGTSGNAPADKTGDKEKKTLLDLTTDLKAIREDARKREEAAALAGIEDQAAKERATLKQKYDEQATQATQAQAAVLDKLKKNAEAEKPALLKLEVKDDKGNTIKVLTSRADIEAQVAADTANRLAAIEAQRVADAANLEVKIAKDKIAADKKIAEDRAKAIETATKAEIEDLKNQQAQITGNTSEELEKRFRLEREIQIRNRSLLKDESAVKAFDATTAKANADAERAIAHQAKLEEIAELATLDEQQRATDLLAIDEKLDAELEANKLNEAKKIELMRDAADARAKIEEDFLARTDAMYRASVQFKSLLIGALTDAFKSEDNKQLDQERAKINQERQLIKEQVASGILDKKAARDQSAALDARQRKIDETEGGASVKFIESLRLRAVKFGAALQERATKETADLSASLQDKIAKKEKVTTKEREQLFVSAGSAIAGTLIEVSAKGQLLTKEGSDAILATAASSLKALLNVYAAGIFGSALSFLGPIAGPIAAGLAMGVLNLLEDAALSGLGIKTARFGEPYVPGDPSKGDIHPYLLTAGERVVTVADNRFWGPLIDGGPTALLKLFSVPMPAMVAMLDLVPAAHVTATAALEQANRAAIAIGAVSDTLETLTDQQSIANKRLVGIEAHAESTAKSNRFMANQKPATGGLLR